MSLGSKLIFSAKHLFSPPEPAYCNIIRRIIALSFRIDHRVVLSLHRYLSSLPAISIVSRSLPIIIFAVVIPLFVGACQNMRGKKERCWWKTENYMRLWFKWATNECACIGVWCVTQTLEAEVSSKGRKNWGREGVKCGIDSKEGRRERFRCNIAHISNGLVRRRRPSWDGTTKGVASKNVNKNEKRQNWGNGNNLLAMDIFTNVPQILRNILV